MVDDLKVLFRGVINFQVSESLDSEIFIAGQ